jgi:uncharacterized membrane protein YgcG
VALGAPRDYPGLINSSSSVPTSAQATSTASTIQTNLAALVMRESYGGASLLPRLYLTLALSCPAADYPGASLVVMRRTLTLILGVALFGIMAAVVVASQGADDPANHDATNTVEQRTTTTEDNPARQRDDDAADQNEDVRGNCDEAEHANDPRCTGQATPDDNPGDDDVNDDRVDNSGPGSENSGPGSIHSGRDDRGGEVEPGDDRGGDGEVEPGDDNGGQGEIEAGDDRGGQGEVEAGDDRGGNSGRGGGDDGGSGGGGHSGRG